MGPKSPITSQAQNTRIQSVGRYGSEKPKSNHTSGPEHQVRPPVRWAYCVFRTLFLTSVCNFVTFRNINVNIWRRKCIKWVWTIQKHRSSFLCKLIFNNMPKICIKLLINWSFPYRNPYLNSLIQKKVLSFSIRLMCRKMTRFWHFDVDLEW